MPSINIVTDDGKFIPVPVPEGFQPTEEEVAQMAADAGLPPVNITPPHPADTSAPGAPPRDVSVRGTFARSMASILRAVEQRTIDPIETIFTLDPKVGTLPRLGATAQLVGNIAGMSSPVGLAMLGAGTGMQAGVEAATGSPGLGLIAGGVTELGAGLFDFLATSGRVVKPFLQRMRGVKEALPETGTLSRGEQVGERLVNQVREGVETTKNEFNAAFSVLERRIEKATPFITSAMPAYADLSILVNTAETLTGTAQLPARARKVVNAISLAISEGKSVPTDQILTLRTHLQDAAAAANITGLAEGATSAKQVNAVRRVATDVLKKAAPQDLANEFTKLQKDYKYEYARPRRFLKALLKEGTSPLQAFRAVMAADDPNVLRNVSTFVEKVRGGRETLRLGYAEEVSRVLFEGGAGASSGGAKAILKQLQDFKPTLRSLGIVTEEELASLDFLLQKNMGPRILSELTSEARRGQVLMRGVLGATLATQVASHPLLLGASALAFAAPSLRRMAMTPQGSRASRALAGAIFRQIGQGMQLAQSMPRVKIEFPAPEADELVVE